MSVLDGIKRKLEEREEMKKLKREREREENNYQLQLEFEMQMREMEGAIDRLETIKDTLYETQEKLRSDAKEMYRESGDTEEFQNMLQMIARVEGSTESVRKLERNVVVAKAMLFTVANLNIAANMVTEVFANTAELIERISSIRVSNMSDLRHAIPAINSALERSKDLIGRMTAIISAATKSKKIPKEKVNKLKDEIVAEVKTEEAEKLRIRQMKEKMKEGLSEA